MKLRIRIKLTAMAFVLLLFGASGQISHPDYPALKALYDATSGQNWTFNSNWLTNAPLDTWTGISLNSEGRVYRINLYSNNLIGEIPPEIGDLEHLEWLLLELNSLSGEVPHEISNLQMLRIVNLNLNNLSGTIPASIGTIGSLEVLQLAHNQLEGQIPGSFGDLSNLRYLNLSFNNLGGVLGPEIFYLTNLEVLWLGENQIEGPIPIDLTLLTDLEYLSLGGNQLTGEIPADLALLANLKYLGLGANRLVGEIPSSLGNLTNLENLSLNVNELEGEIPDSFGNLVNIDVLLLHANNLTGDIPSSMSNLNFGNFVFHTNQISGMPDFSSNTSGVIGAANNQLDFLDLVPNANLLLSYAPQDSLDDAIVDEVPPYTTYSMKVTNQGPGSVYQWYHNGNPISGANSSSYQVSSFLAANEGAYTCSITNPTLPQLTLHRRVIALSLDDDVASSEQVLGLEIEESLSVYPNPSSEKIHLQLDPSIEATAWVLSDLKGRKLNEGQIEEENHLSIDISSLVPGTYVLKVNTDVHGVLSRTVITK